MLIWSFPHSINGKNLGACPDYLRKGLNKVYAFREHMGEQEPSVREIRKLGAGGALLALCNNCKKIYDRRINISYDKKEYLEFTIHKNPKQAAPKHKADTGQDNKEEEQDSYDYSSGIPVNKLLDFVYGIKKHRQVEYTNLGQRFGTLCRKEIVDKITKNGKPCYVLHVEKVAFIKILVLLARESKIRNLLFTDYFKKFGRKYLRTIYEAIPDGLLDVDPHDEKQVELYAIFLFDRYLRSPTFREIFLSPKAAARLTFLQEALNASYLRNQSKRDRFPFLQTLGTFCIIIDTLRGDKKARLRLSVAELAECLNDVDRAIARHRKLSKRQVKSTVNGLYSPERVKEREQLLNRPMPFLSKSTTGGVEKPNKV